MARLIPPTTSPDCASSGEAEVLHRLKNDSGAGRWVILHSLDVPRHRSQVTGEIDFVVIVPGKGVLCVEVKACSHLRRSEGQWYYGLNAEPDSRGPFKQAAEGMHSLRERLVSERPELARVVFWSVVIFPFIEFQLQPYEWHAWQVIDSRSFRAGPLSKSLEAVLDRAREFLGKCPSVKWFVSSSEEPTLEQANLIAGVLRPDFEFYESIASRAGRLREELKRYTDEQFSALDAMQENSRVLFKGPGGTGKTLLALEAARRAANVGRQVMLVCFNRLLGGWLEEQVSGLAPRVTARTLHSEMLETACIRVNDSDARGEQFWQNTLPSAAIEKLLQGEMVQGQFDELIVDEAQDLLRGNYLDYLDLRLKGGLAAGRWRFFGDFERQAIYGGQGQSAESLLEKRVGMRVPVYALRVNCRNTPRVAALARLLGGLSPDYTRVLRPDDRVEPELRYFSDEEEQCTLLEEVLRKFGREGYRRHDIVILSSRKDCCAARMRGKTGLTELTLLDGKSNGPHYTSIHSFKGLEATAVIITDIEAIEGVQAQALFYIAVTRSLQKLVILLKESVKSQIAGLILAGAGAGT